MSEDALFAWGSTPVAESEPAEKLSPDQRRTRLQSERLAKRVHPISAAGGYWPVPLHAEAAPVDDRDADGRRCGNCYFRVVRLHHDRSYPKCTWSRDGGTTYPRVTNGAASDVRAWWPGCIDHEWGDNALSPDAARWVPGGAS